MNNLSVKIKTRKDRTISLEMDAERLERLAASFGFFNKEFLGSLTRAERDYKAGRIKKLKSLCFF